MLYSLLKVFEADDIPYPINQSLDNCRTNYKITYLHWTVEYGTSDEEYPTDSDTVSRWLLKNGTKEKETVLILF